MISWLEPDQAPLFPDTASALSEPNGLLAAGGNLTIDWLLEAYSRGIFPWFNPDQPILWWTPTPRMVLLPKDFHTSKSLRKFLKTTDYQLQVNQNFVQVIHQCALIREQQSGTWITKSMIHAYQQMHEAGHAHSVECYDGEGQLVGGLYGVVIGRVFFGESMYSLAANASKFCLKKLAESGQFDLIDCQMETPHLLSLGAKSISREHFEKKLKCLINLPEA